MMLRKAAPEDASRLAEILIFAKRTAYRGIFNNDKVSFGEMLVLPLALAYQNDPASLANILVYEDEFVKGMVKTSEEMMENGLKAAEIKEFYVDPFFQGYGIGSILLTEIQDRVRRKGIDMLFLWVLEKNEKARSFYEKKGFLLTNEKKLEEGTAEYMVKYTKSL